MIANENHRLRAGGYIEIMRLYAAEDNLAAMAFYRHWGFEKLGEERGRFGRIWLLEKKLGGAGYV